jgi:hypothetical protein
VEHGGLPGVFLQPIAKPMEQVLRDYHELLCGPVRACCLRACCLLLACSLLAACCLLRQTRPDQTRPHQTTPDHTRPDNIRAHQTRLLLLLTWQTPSCDTCSWCICLSMPIHNNDPQAPSDHYPANWPPLLRKGEGAERKKKEAALTIKSARKYGVE